MNDHTYAGSTYEEVPYDPEFQPFTVVWRINIEASSAKQAAEEALKIQRDSASIATVFSVTDYSGKTIDIDLLKHDA
jgi:hypothetical protein